MSDALLPNGRMHRALQGFSLEDGSLLWTLEEIICRWVTHTIWPNGDKECLLVPTEGTAELRMVDPSTGEVVWTEQTGPNIASVVTHENYAILNSRPDPEKNGEGLYGCYRISLEGPELLWQLPDDINYLHAWDVSDNSNHRWVAIRDSLAIVIIRPARSSNWEKHDCRLLVLRTEDGHILHDHRMNQGNGPEMKSQRIRLPYLLGDRLILMTDMNHGTSGYGGYYYKIGNDGKLTYKGELPILHFALTSYETPIEIPCADGRMYYRSIRGIACYDILSGETSASLPGMDRKQVRGVNSPRISGAALTVESFVPRGNPMRITISNVLGRKVFEKTIISPGIGIEKRVLLSTGLAQGTYCTTVQGAGQSVVHPVLLR